MRLRTTDLYQTEVDGRAVLLDARSSEYLAVNHAGALLVGILADDVTVDVLVDALVARFDIAESTARSDVDTFLGALRDRRFLEE